MAKRDWVFTGSSIEANNQTLIITDHKVTTVSEAEALAGKLLKLHNKFEREATFTLVGNPLLAAGLTVTLSGFGMWDGKYLIKQSKHDISSSGYTTKIKLRAVYAHSSEKTAKEETTSSGGSSGSSSQTSTPKKSDKYHWETTCTALLYDRPYETGNPGKQVGKASKGSTVTLLGSTSKGYTLISAGGASGGGESTGCATGSATASAGRGGLSTSGASGTTSSSSTAGSRVSSGSSGSSTSSRAGS